MTQSRVPRALMAATAWGHYSGTGRSAIESCAADDARKDPNQGDPRHAMGGFGRGCVWT
jgi:hypothetical protein